MVSGVDGLVGGVNLAEIAAESVFEVVKSGLDIGCHALHDRFNGAVRQIADIAGQIVATSRTVGGVAKAHSLDPTFEDDLFGSLLHHYRKLSYSEARRLRLQ